MSIAIKHLAELTTCGFSQLIIPQMCCYLWSRNQRETIKVGSNSYLQNLQVIVLTAHLWKFKIPMKMHYKIDTTANNLG